ncbi:hypothetical protein A1O3_09946 [Capronia epimyces CBS 606.96]|uniref:Peroxin-19 n=1 Tax=Capronia epimyces CBS 606.96 TaxID=1182542 RepID=W9XB44_9EURO|nr:uncharacterized protein A1O3_09946 [Capronia epimyces CBS 606.96]EXJ77717.1 hypothetical protein A1O3_09946 [Capronia epimyces CBS 606.96]
MAQPPQPPSAHDAPASSPPTIGTDRSSQPQAPVTVEDADSDPDFDDLDDVLDQFSAAAASQAKPQSQPAPSSSGPGRPAASAAGAPSTAESALPPDIPIPQGHHASESEEEFMARLTAEMSNVMSKMSLDPAASASTSDDIAKMGRELEEFTYKMEAEGVQPEDLLKAILGEETGTQVAEVAEAERDRRESESKSKSRSPEKLKSNPGTTVGKEAAASTSSSSSSSQQKSKTSSSFEDTIRKTMARMESSSAAATSATAQASSAKSEEDILAEMLRALESEGAGVGDGSDGDLSKMFLGMMEQLTNKDMLYEPMKELSTKYPEWLEQNRPKIDESEFGRFSRQRVIVDEIVAKFEEPSYSDDSAQCREFVWEKMQAMQSEGAPPEDLIANPFPGMGMPGLGLGDDTEKLEDGCPTQ